jgi:hypothetical protein|tara:strand:+ start:290 stop:520 length:231 start_codon:yes stop_codon:yes gene_type:complete
MATITLTGLRAGWTVHVHAAELDAEATVPDSGTVTFTVAADFHAVMPQGIQWGSTGEGGILLPKIVEAGGSYSVGF